MLKNKAVSIILAVIMILQPSTLHCSADQIADEDIKRYVQSMFIEYKVDSMNDKEIEDLLKNVDETEKQLLEAEQTYSNNENIVPDFISSIKISIKACSHKKGIKNQSQSYN